MSIFLAYLRKRMAFFIWFFIGAVLFSGIFFLYQLPGEPLLYAVLLYGAMALAAMAIDFLRFCVRHQRLLKARKAITVVDTDLPETADLIEQDYQTLIHEVLDSKQKLARSAARERQEMIEYYTVWVHQIKTPIAAMQLLLQKEDNAQSRALASQLFSIEQYVAMVLAYLRLGSESSDYVLKRYALDKVVRKAVRKFAPLFIEKHLTLDLHPLKSRVLTDEKWLCFVLEQLLSNAVKYTPSGGTVTIEEETEDVLVIRDTGIGIAPEDLPRVCEKGYTGINGRTDQRASGIGLYLCRQTLGCLGHQMSVESAPGQGTRVRLNLHAREGRMND